MKRSTASWTTAVAASALLALPVGSWAQQPTPSTTPRQTTGAPAPQTPGADTQQGSANEHLRQAQSALADIPAASLTGTSKTRVAELKRHLSALERAASQKPASGAATARSASWSTDVAAADRILTELLGSTGTTGAATPAPAGTTGSTATAPRTTTSAKPEASMTLDESARTKLQEVRTHITAFAAAMSGGSASTPSSTPAPSSDDPSAPASASAASASATPSPAAATGAIAAPTPTGTSGRTATPTEPTATPATPAEPAAAATATPAQSSTQPPATQPPATTPATPSPTPSQQVDAETVKRHLTAARDVLSQLTQLPAAAQLTGDARTQVSQLISNFNELLTTNVDWRSAYSKLQGNLTALVGDQRADESPTPAAPAAGAVGTSGTVAIDPAIRAKLVEFRSHLTEFEKAAGGSGTPAEPSAAASTTAAPSTSTTAAPSTSTTAAPSASTTAAPSASPTGTASTPTASPAPAATTGSTSQTPGTAGTSGTGTPMPAAAEQATKPSTSGRDAASSQAGEGHREAMNRIEAIEAIINGASPAGTSGDTASKTTTKAGTLDHAQIEQIRTHLAELRKELNKNR